MLEDRTEGHIDATMSIRLEEFIDQLGLTKRRRAIIVLTDTSRNKIYELKDQEEVLIGRKDGCHIVLEDAYASRLHAKIFVKDDRVYIQDLGSRNGTYVNFRAVSISELSNGDKIIVGRSILKYIESDELEFSLNEELYKATLFDPLTEVYSRRTMETKMRIYFDRFSKYRDIFWVFMADIDHFKGLNDNYGHVFGDLVLRHVAGVLKETVGSRGEIFRYGGEEFCIVIPRLSVEDCIAISDCIMENIRSKTFQGIIITISMGIDRVKEGDVSYLQVIQRADSNLYVAKRSGKNQYILSS